MQEFLATRLELVQHLHQRVKVVRDMPIMDLGLIHQQQTDERHERYKKGIRCWLPDDVVRNFPLELPQFLEALQWWPTADDDDDNLVIPCV
jgi:hypothetical protein